MINTSELSESDTRAVQRRRHSFQVVPAAFAFVITDGQVLLHRRRNTGFMDLHLDVPSGHVEPGETPIQCATRELKEEAVLSQEAGSLALFNVMTCEQPEVAYQYFMFVCNDIGEQKPVIGEPDKCDNVGFYDISKLRKSCDPISPIIMQALENYNEYMTNRQIVFDIMTLSAGGGVAKSV